MARNWKDLKVPKIGQGTTILCWLACYKMLYGWKGREISKVQPKIEAAGISLNEIYTEDKWARGRNALGLTSYRSTFLKEEKNLQWLLEKCGPVWLAGNYLNGSGHAIVISGYLDQHKMYRVEDPWEIATGKGIRGIKHASLYRKLRKSFASVQVWP